MDHQGLRNPVTTVLRNDGVLHPPRSQFRFTAIPETRSRVLVSARDWATDTVSFAVTSHPRVNAEPRISCASASAAGCRTRPWPRSSSGRASPRSPRSSRPTAAVGPRNTLPRIFFLARLCSSFSSSSRRRVARRERRDLVSCSSPEPLLPPATLAGSASRRSCCCATASATRTDISLTETARRRRVASSSPELCLRQPGSHQAWCVSAWISRRRLPILEDLCPRPDADRLQQLQLLPPPLQDGGEPDVARCLLHRRGFHGGDGGPSFRSFRHRRRVRGYQRGGLDHHRCSPTSVLTWSSSSPGPTCPDSPFLGGSSGKETYTFDSSRVAESKGCF